MTLDRFAYYEALSCYAHDFGRYGLFDQIRQRGYRPSPLLNERNLDPTAQELYYAACDKYANLGPWDRPLT